MTVVGSGTVKTANRPMSALKDGALFGNGE